MSIENLAKFLSTPPDEKLSYHTKVFYKCCYMKRYPNATKISQNIYWIILVSRGGIGNDLVVVPQPGVYRVQCTSSKSWDVGYDSPDTQGDDCLAAHLNETVSLDIFKAIFAVVTATMCKIRKFCKNQKTWGPTN